MSYTKTTWVNDETPVNATNMNKIESALEALWPKVGDIEINVSGTNPSTKYPGTTWVQFGAGKTLVGLNSSDTDFDVVEETGGSKGAWRHIHDHNGQTWSWGDTSATLSIPTGSVVSYYSGNNTLSSYQDIYGWKNTFYAGSTNNLLAADKANMPPYIVVYFWKCTEA